MNAKTTIRRILFIALWLSIGGGMLTLLLAAISSKKKGVCSDYTITLKGNGTQFFITEKDVEALLMKDSREPLRGRAVESFNLHSMEELLEKNTWISEAEIYFDNKDVLHVQVTEKEPVARIFNTAGASYYIDAEGKQLPLSDKRSAAVPVFTGFPAKKQFNAMDSLLLQQVSTTAALILANPFWMAQVAQVDITPDRKFELVPVVGNHLVRLGDGENMPAKFNRLLLFYRQVLSKTGFDRYKLIDVQYKGQVVASRYAGDPKVDSVQLRKNVEKLLKQWVEAANDTTVKRLTPVTTLETDSADKNETLPVENKLNPEQNNDPNPGLEGTTPSVPKRTDGQTVTAAERPTAKPVTKRKESTRPKEPVKKATGEKKEPVRKPKAVMPKRTGEEENEGYN